MFEEIPVNVIYKGDPCEDIGILNQVRQTGLFYPKKYCSKYFTLLVEALLTGKDPLSIINQFLPHIDGQMYLEIHISEDCSVYLESHPLCDIPIQKPSLTDLNQNLLKLFDQLQLSKTRTQHTGIMSRLLSGLYPSKEMAEVYFMKKNYEEALCTYEKLGAKYPELSERMCEICRCILGRESTRNPLTIDILIFYKRFDDLYEISKILPIDAKLGLQIYLIEQNIDFRKKLILMFCCCVYFREIHDFDRADEYLKMLSKEIDTLKEGDMNRMFWVEVAEVLKEYQVGQETIIH